MTDSYLETAEPWVPLPADEPYEWLDQEPDDAPFGEAA